VNIRHQISLLVVAGFLAIMTIGGYAIWQAGANARAVRSVTEGAVPSALASADLVSTLKDVQLATMNLLAAPDARLLDQARGQLTASERQLKTQLALQTRLASGDVQRGLVIQAQDVLDNYLAAIGDTAKFKQNGQNDLASATFAASVQQYQDNLQQIVVTLRVEKNRSKDEAILSLNRSLAGTATTLSVVTVVMLLVLGMLGGLLYRRIVHPISRMQATMSDIAESQDFSRRVPVGREDEIGKSVIAFNSMVARIEQSSAQLRQKTNDIQSMLQNIPQGILTLVDGGLIHHEYSAWLETILDTHDIAGRDIMQLLFTDTDLGADTLSQLSAAIGSCLGEDVMNFEFNRHLLVGELTRRMPDGRSKVLDLNWSPILGDNDCVERLMLCVRDVTELRALAAEANEQKRELAMIGEILAVSQEKFHDFVAGSLSALAENENLIRQYPHGDAGVVGQLFRNMHTIKGNARTYGLVLLTHAVHQAEQTYDELRKKKPDIVWDQGVLLAELTGVREQIEHYARINEVSLGRKGPGRSSGDRYLLVDREQIRDTIHRLETVNTGNLHELIAVRDAVHRVLYQMGSERLSEMLAGVLESLPSLAGELGKPEPSVHISDNGITVRNQVAGTLKNIFMHLMRNAMDHGLELPAERAKVGKAEQGAIDIGLALDGDRFEIRLRDDGRGLALARIRDRARAAGLIAPDAVPDDRETAQLIFRAGFSTASAVSEISGRGVGMDAVQAFARREGGTIELRFLDEAQGADFRRFETVLVLPAQFAVGVDAPRSRLAPAVDLDPSEV
jgi:two-component system, chemotaxis family, sensor kinase CheA